MVTQTSTLTVGKSLIKSELVLYASRGEGGKVDGFPSYKWGPIGDLKVGDLVATPDGVGSVVQGVYDFDDRPIYRVTFVDDSYVDCDLEHLWPVEITSYTNDKLPYEVYPLSKIKTLHEKGLNCRVPLLTAPTDLGKVVPRGDFELDQPIDPYILGLILGGGHFGKTSVEYCTTDDELADAVLDYGFQEDGLHHVLPSGRTLPLRNFSIHSTLHPVMWDRWSSLGLEGKTEGDKFVPNSYLNSSSAVRLAVLQGLMDAGGTVGEYGRNIEFSSKSLQLATDVQYLVRSLGGQAKLREYWIAPPGHTDKPFYYRVDITIHAVSLFRLARKKARELLDLRRRSDKRISSIEYRCNAPARCIKISHPLGLFITRDFTVTHNTTLAVHAVAAMQKANPDSAALYLDYEHAFDASYAHRLGVDLDPNRFVFVQPDYFEQGDLVIDTILEADAIDLIVIDSTAAMTPLEDLEGKIETSGRIGLQAQLMSRMLARLTKKLSRGRKPALLLINQTRSRIDIRNPRNSGEDSAGGNALKFYTSIRLKLEVSAHEGDDERDSKQATDKLHTRNRVRVTSVKNKLAPPFMRGVLTIDYGRGVNNAASIAELAETKLPSFSIGRTGHFKYEGDTPETSFSGRGREEFAQFLNDNPIVMAEIQRKVLAAMQVEQSATLGLAAPRIIKGDVEVISSEDDDGFSFGEDVSISKTSKVLPSSRSPRPSKIPSLKSGGSSDLS